MTLELVADTRADVINSLHTGIIEKLRSSVSDAIEAGRLLVEQKDDLAHGEFLTWIEENCRFSRQTADNYRRLYEHRDKLPTVSNLQDAYRKVEQIETAEKQHGQRVRKERVNAYLNTGEKPDDWNRADDYEAKKTEKLRESRDRIDQSFESSEETVSRDDIDRLVDQARETVKAETEHFEKHAHMDLSTYAENMTQRSMFVTIERYINTFDTLSAQIEGAHNLIKKLKMITNDLQAQSAGDAQ